MEKHILHGIVITEIPRPEKSRIEQFSGFTAAKIAAATHGKMALEPSIRPIYSGHRVCGPAVTVLSRMGDALWLQRVADIACEGDVIVVDGGGSAELSVVGERIMHYMMVNRGVSGLIVDGAVRDIAGAAEFGFPIWAKGSVARLYSANAPGAVNVMIQCGGLVVEPGDLVVADDTGAAIVPLEMVDHVMALVKQQIM